MVNLHGVKYLHISSLLLPHRYLKRGSRALLHSGWQLCHTVIPSPVNMNTQLRHVSLHFSRYSADSVFSTLFFLFTTDPQGSHYRNICVVGAEVLQRDILHDAKQFQSSEGSQKISVVIILQYTAVEVRVIEKLLLLFLGFVLPAYFSEDTPGTRRKTFGDCWGRLFTGRTPLLSQSNCVKAIKRLSNKKFRENNKANLSSRATLSDCSAICACVFSRTEQYSSDRTNNIAGISLAETRQTCKISNKNSHKRETLANIS